jgi:DNA-binding transcriptional ArsR family regulator
MTDSPLLTAVSVHKALAHPARLRIVAAVRDGELCVCQLTALLDLAPSTVSAHLAELKGAGLLAERREGRWVYYAIAPGSATGMVARLIPGLDRDPTIAADAEAARRLRAIPVEEFCALDTDGRMRVAAPTHRST